MYNEFRFAINNKSRLFGFQISGWVALMFTMFAYFLLISQFVESWDDVMYSFVHVEKSGGREIVWEQPVNSLYDAIASQCVDYRFFNGRALTHTIVQLFCGSAVGKVLFGILMSICFGFFLIGVQMLVRYTTGRSSSLLTIVTALFVLLIIPPYSFLGSISFAVNYLGASTALLWSICIILFYNKNDSNNRLVIGIKCICLFIFGAMHEGFSIPMSAFLLLWCLINRKNLDRNLLIMIICYWAGTLLVTVAPANFLRFAEVQAEHNNGLFRKVLSVSSMLIRDYFQIQLLVVFLFILAFRYKKLKTLATKLLPFLTICIAAVLFDVIIAWKGDHQLTPVCVMEVVVVSILWVMYVPAKVRHNKYLNSVWSFLLICFYAAILTTRISYKQTFNNLLTAAAQSESGIVIAKDFYEKRKTVPKILRKFSQDEDIRRFVEGGKDYRTVLSALATDGCDINKVKSILPSPIDDIMKFIRHENELKSDIYDAGNFLVVKQHSDDFKSDLFYTSVPTRYDKLKSKFNLYNENQRVSCLQKCNSFQDSCYIYSIVFLKSGDIKTLELK